MKKALLKDSIKEIKKTYKRFLSIMLMSFLGVGFFAGIRATSPDMTKTIDNYFKENDVYDIEMMSTLGLTDEDISLLKSNEYVSDVIGTYSKDFLVKVKENDQPVVKVISLEDMNSVELIEGEMPTSDNECVVEKLFLIATRKNIGDTIEVYDEDEAIKNDSLKITGVIESPLYVSSDRGTSTLGTGKVNYYIYVPRHNFDMDVYTQIYIKVKNSDNYITGSDEYVRLVSEATNSIKQYENEINTRRYDTLIEEANNKIEDAQNELDTERNENQQKIDDAQKQIDDYRKEIENARATLQNSRIQVYNTFLEYENQISDGKSKIDEAKLQLEEQKKSAQQNVVIANDAKLVLQENISNIDISLNIIVDKYSEVYNTLENPGDLSQEEIEYLKGLKLELENEKENLEQAKIELNEKIYNLDLTIEQINQGITNAENAILDQQISLTEKENEVVSAKAQAYQTLDNSELEINNNEQKINESQEELDKNKAEFDEKIKEAEEKIIDAKEEALNIEKPKLYILEREDNTGYSGFIQDTQSIENIGKVFPIVFFVVATLISLTSMTRMVEEQRQQIGTLKALGYTKYQISMKYILYASLATILGGVVGMIVCFYILPKIIWMMYDMMYDIPNFVIEFNTSIALLGLGCAILCIVGATIYACIKELIERPAVLMRPKAPKSGKRVILEKVPFIWNKMNFTTKVTVRNMFRYKKRFLMTIIGIFGCTSLILFGFLLKDSVANIVNNQYGKIFNYNFISTAKSSLTDEEVKNLNYEISQNNNVEKSVVVELTSASVTNGEEKEDVQIIVPDNTDEIYDLINFLDLDKNKIDINSNGVYITDKLASILGVKPGDSITIVTNDDKEIDVRIENIVKNYVYHYMYLSKDLYNKVLGEYSSNAVLIKTLNISSEEKDELATEIMSNSKVSSVTNIDSMKNTIDNMMGLMKYVVWVLIVSAGLLAFVVLYNLATVNISERIRELATIKVLGFYDNEVYNYVAKETTILTFIGIALGMVGGIILNSFILKTCEINVLRFEAKLNWYSFVIAALITIVFTIIVNIATYYALKKIDMIESLKSVE